MHCPSITEQELVSSNSRTQTIASPSPHVRMSVTRFRRCRQFAMSRLAVPAFAAVFLLMAGGCMDDGGTNPVLVAPDNEPPSDSGSPPDPDPPAEASPDPSLQRFTVDASGGTVSYQSTEEDVSLTLTFPPGALSEVGLPEQAIPLALLFFNVGVEVGQLLFVLAVALIVLAVRRAPARLPRGAELAAPYAIGAVAMFWVIERVAGF